MQKPDNNLEILEEQFLDLAAEAVVSAYNQARKSGRRIVFSNPLKPEIIESLPNGESRVLKNIEAPLNIAIGTIVQIP